MASKSLAERLTAHQYPSWYFSQPWVLKVVYAWFALIYQRVGLSFKGIHTILRKLPAGATVLDAGFGEGQFLYGNARRNPHLHFVGLDFNSNTLELGRFLIQHKGLKNVKLSQADLSKPWPVSSNSLDAIWCIGVLHCIPKDSEVLKNASNCLKPNAPLLIYSPLQSRLVLGPYKYVIRKYPGYDRLYRSHDYSMEELVEKAKQAGLQLQAARFTHGLPGIISYELFTLLVTLITHGHFPLKVLSALFFLPCLPLVLILRWIDQLFPPQKQGNGLLIEFLKA